MTTDKIELHWTSDAAHSGSSTNYDVVRGRLDELPVGSGSSETCIEPGSPDTASHDVSMPAVGTGFYYVVRGRNGCATGGYGSATSGAERTSSSCRRLTWSGSSGTRPDQVQFCLLAGQIPIDEDPLGAVGIPAV